MIETYRVGSFVGLQPFSFFFICLQKRHLLSPKCFNLSLLPKMSWKNLFDSERIQIGKSRNSVCFLSKLDEIHKHPTSCRCQCRRMDRFPSNQATPLKMKMSPSSCSTGWSVRTLYQNRLPCPQQQGSRPCEVNRSLERPGFTVWIFYPTSLSISAGRTKEKISWSLIIESAHRHHTLPQPVDISNTYV